ncbi:sigma factor G inhibitor Gin [Oceanirhabdus sp. W0125-5]|uniref:sigma factor G inhibitor Gin n=1 Tax=Oceanirhabdus sp. W0125-5 TaxID=2999116 RepID=UPI0022F3056B|nr:sigma factor G inhibitor Gin [Oceanirhabdus sp. W0125-5]WBW97497.1 sigma factor G inhibitor Gin [Oceanirhabdus sp. W0125-5]
MRNCKCIVCGRTLKDGIILEGKLICSRCEKRMLIENNYTDIYKLIKNRIKKHIVPNMKYY